VTNLPTQSLPEFVSGNFFHQFGNQWIAKLWQGNEIEFSMVKKILPKFDSKRNACQDCPAS